MNIDLSPSTFDNFIEEIETKFSDLIVNENLLRNVTVDNGQGAFAIVYKTHFKRYNCYAAVKSIKMGIHEVQNIVLDENFFKSLIQELTIMAFKTDHSNIPKLYGVNINKKSEKIDFINEYIEGLTLHQIIKKETNIKYNIKNYNNWTYIEKVWVVYKLALILEYIKSIGIIHRDVKPENIIIENDSNLEPILIDFGLSKIKTGESSYTAPKYTVKYSPPENILNLEDEEDYRSYIELFANTESTTLNIDDNLKVNITSKVDVYSLGCVIYETFTGDEPYDKTGKVKKGIINEFEKKTKIYCADDANRIKPEIFKIIEHSTALELKKRWDMKNVIDELELILKNSRSDFSFEDDKISYKGQRVQNGDEWQYDGLGKFTDKKDNKNYIGSYQLNKRYGFGIMREYKNDIDEKEPLPLTFYQGSWKNDMKDGFGYFESFYRINSSVYTDYYIGCFKKDEKFGYGLMVDDNAVNCGLFINGKIVEGYRYEKDDEIIYKGYFNEDTFCFGEVYYLKENEIYFGQMELKNKHGYGYVKKKNKIKKCGRWESDKLVEKVDPKEINFI